MRAFNDPPPNLMQGIQWMQSGQRRLALDYLRLAARTEPMIAEGWLWLAAATDDLEEYRYAVLQALKLDPRHPVAIRMRDALARQEAAPDATVMAMPWAGALAETGPRDEAGAAVPPSRGRRWLRVVGLLALVLVCGAMIATAIAVGRVVIDSSGDTPGAAPGHSITVGIGGSERFRFQVRVPDSWLPADTDDPPWIAARERLAAAFPVPEGQIGVWQQVEASFAAATRDPVYGGVLPRVRVVETDTDILARDGMVAALTLHEIAPLPDPVSGEGDDVCARMRLLERDLEASGALASHENVTLVGSGLETRDGDCAYWIQRRLDGLAPHEVPFPVTIDRAPGAVREVVIYVPAGNERYAVWRLTLADAAYAAHADTVTQVIATLRAVG